MIRLKLIGLLGIVAVLLAPAAAARATALPLAPRIGDTYDIVLTRLSEQHDSHGSSGSSTDKDTIVERVIGVRADGLELEYDLPKDASADERAGHWEFPARVFKPSGGPAQLLNSPELEARVDSWLKAANWTRAVCGHWIFTWNAFRIECDPQSVLETIAAFDLRSGDIREGAPFQEPGALGTGTLVRKTSGGATFEVEMPVDPDAVRRGRAQSDVAAGEILRKPVTLDAALRARAQETVTGTVRVEFETDSGGDVRRRTKVTKLDITMPDGQSETQTVTETLERRLISRHD